MRKATTFLILRHQVVDNPDNIFYGVSRDLPLSTDGRNNARALGELCSLAGIKPTTIITSPLLRARQTGEEFRKGLGLRESKAPLFLRRLQVVRHIQSSRVAVRVDPHLSDVSYPALEGKTVDAEGFVTLETEGRVSLDAIEAYTAEPLDKAAKRFHDALHGISRKHPGELVVIVSHADPIAYGLERIQHGENAIYEIGKLENKGAYLQKGEVALLTLTTDGHIEGQVHFRPDITEIPSLRERIRSGGKEN